ncbi:MAG: hypothetical protein AAGM22_26760 [Acidobacteriota bacterium]
MMTSVAKSAAVGLVIVSVALAPPATAGSLGLDIDVEEVSVSPDITFEYFGAALTDRQATVIGDPAGRVEFATLPAGVELTGFHIEPDKTFFAVDQPVVVDGQLITPRDVAVTDGTVSLAVDGAALGVGRGAAVDAVTLLDGEIVVSYDTAVTLGGNPVFDEDLVQVTGGAPTVVFDGSSAGLAPGLDVDAAHYLTPTILALSTDGAFTFDGITVDDEDVVAFSGTTPAEKIYDGSSAGAGWAPADLGGLFIMDTPPDPGLIFEDGFEGGDTASWSAIVQQP